MSLATICFPGLCVLIGFIMCVASSKKQLCHCMGMIPGKSVKKGICCLLKQTKKGEIVLCFILLLFCLLSLLKTIESNWRCGRHSLQRIHCRSETSKGVYCLQYDDQKIVSGLRDNTIKVRLLQNGILMAHSAYAINNSVLISVTPTQSPVNNLAFSFPHLTPACLFYLARETLFSYKQTLLAEFLSISNYRLCNYCALYPDEKGKTNVHSKASNIKDVNVLHQRAFRILYRCH